VASFVAVAAFPLILQAPVDKFIVNGRKSFHISLLASAIKK
jgi:hypothetical protein